MWQDRQRVIEWMPWIASIEVKVFSSVHVLQLTDGCETQRQQLETGASAQKQLRHGRVLLLLFFCVAALLKQLCGFGCFWSSVLNIWSFVDLPQEKR